MLFSPPLTVLDKPKRIPCGMFTLYMDNCFPVKPVVKFNHCNVAEKVWILTESQLIHIVFKRVKPVLSGHSKIDKTNALMTNGSLMKVETLQNAPIGAFCNTFALH